MKDKKVVQVYGVSSSMSFMQIKQTMMKSFKFKKDIADTLRSPAATLAEQTAEERKNYYKPR